MKKLVSVTLFLLMFSMLNCYSQAHIHHQPDRRGISNTRPGLLNITEINGGAGLFSTDTDYSKGFVGLTDIVGIGFLKNFSAGIGAGISIYNGGKLLPVMADLRYFINLKKLKIYVSGDGGILLNLTDKEEGRRYFVNPALGLQFPVSKRTALNFGGGLFTQFRKGNARDSFVNAKAGLTYFFTFK